MNKDIHMSFKNYKEIGYNHELDLSIVMYWMFFHILGEVGAKYKNPYKALLTYLWVQRSLQ